MNGFKRTIDRISYVVSGLFPGWLVVIMSLLVLVEVFTRYVLRHALRVSDEFSAYLYVAIVFMGAAYTM